MIHFYIFSEHYATSVIVPPQITILATAKIRDVVLAVQREPKIQRILPLPLTFDHRAVTGGEATCFLGVLIQDLEQAV